MNLKEKLKPYGVKEVKEYKNLTDMQEFKEELLSWTMKDLLDHLKLYESSTTKLIAEELERRYLFKI